MLKSILRKFFSPEIIFKLQCDFFRYFGKNKIKLGSKNTLSVKRSILKGITIICHGHNCSITIGDNNRLDNCKFEIFGNDNHVVIGECNAFKDTSFWLEDSGSSIQIGNRNKLCGYTHLGIAEGQQLVIGDDCMFSKNIYITTTDSHSILDNQTGIRINSAKSVYIRNHVWLGRDVTIGKGVEIFENVIIGGKSYVTKSIQSTNVIAAGIPARVVKENVAWKSERI